VRRVEERIKRDKQVLAGGILKVDSFVNRQVNGVLMNMGAKELAARFAVLRTADVIFQEEFGNAGLIGRRTVACSSAAPETAVSQGFVVLLPVKSVGVMRGQRTYQEIARCVP
jgi:GMP synthase PP-ATPase subunit